MKAKMVRLLLSFCCSWHATIFATRELQGDYRLCLVSRSLLDLFLTIDIPHERGAAMHGRLCSCLLIAQVADRVLGILSDL